MAIYYIDPVDGNDGTGTADNINLPYLTIPTISANNTYSFKGGTVYIATGIIWVNTTDNVTFNSYGIGKAIIDGINVISSRLFRIEANNVFIDNLHIKGSKDASTATSWCINTLDGYSGHKIKNCLLEGNQDIATGRGSGGIGGGGPDMPINYENNEIINCYIGILVKSATSCVPSSTISHIKGNTIHQFSIPDVSDLEGAADGIFLGNTGSVTNHNYNLIISDNNISDYGENGIDCVNQGEIIIENNTIGAPSQNKNPAYNLGASALILGKTDGTGGNKQIVRGNYFHDINGVSGTGVYATIAPRGSWGNLVYANISVNCQRFYAGFISFEKDNKVLNNVIVNDTGGTGSTYSIRQDGVGADLTVINNTFIGCTANPIIQTNASGVINYGSNIFDTSDTVSEGTGTLNDLGGNLFNLDPQLDADYYPHLTSPCVGAGGWSGKILKDYGGRPFKRAHPSIGAREVANRDPVNRSIRD